MIPAVSAGTGRSFGAARLFTVVHHAREPGFKNTTDQAHAAHLHGHPVRLLDALDDGWKPFWLDTILCVPQARTTRIAFVADNRGKWLIERRRCAADGHQDRWFEVT